MAGSFAGHPKHFQCRAFRRDPSAEIAAIPRSAPLVRPLRAEGSVPFGYIQNSRLAKPHIDPAAALACGMTAFATFSRRGFTTRRRFPNWCKICVGPMAALPSQRPSKSMTRIALKMLLGDRSKYFAIVFGVTFACFLIAEQSATFCGVMLRTTSQIRDIHGADVWVMNSGVRYIDDLKAISDDDLFRVRGVAGVDWAVHLYRGQGQAQLSNGTYQGVILMGLDDASLLGGRGK
jgi:hypothetical protein